jgi:hypothetical protein
VDVRNGWEIRCLASGIQFGLRKGGAIESAMYSRSSSPAALKGSKDGIIDFEKASIHAGETKSSLTGNMNLIQSPQRLPSLFTYLPMYCTTST